jgi:hypothetical protein
LVLAFGDLFGDVLLAIGPASLLCFGFVSWFGFASWLWSCFSTVVFVTFSPMKKATQNSRWLDFQDFVAQALLPVISVEF